MQQTIAERVQIMVAQMVSPQTLKSRFWEKREKEGCMRGMGKSHISWACDDPRRGGMEGRKEWWAGGCMLTLRAPRASSQVELGATLSSCPDSGQGRRRGPEGQHTQTFPS